jgi:hypothetical protein
MLCYWLGTKHILLDDRRDHNNNKLAWEVDRLTARFNAVD